jgi:hypothetical protein
MLNQFTFGQEEFFKLADGFLNEYVKEGRIDYELIGQKENQMENLVDEISSYRNIRDDNDTTKAFLINAYNILVIYQIVEHYPVNSPKEIPGFFDRNLYKIAGMDLTLNDLEKSILFNRFPDPRLHFVLVCGALGCPPITNFAYQPDLLEEQLDIQTRLAINNPEFIRSDGDVIEISELFYWYKTDFLKSHSTILEYINSYREHPIEADKKIIEYPYDWQINKISEERKKDKKDVSDESPNVFTYTPSRLLKMGQIEAQLFNNLYTQTAYRDGNREKIELETRDTYYTALFYALFGISQSGRINIGFDLNVKSVLIDSMKTNPLNVFQFENSPVSRTAISSIGPKIKFQPFKTIPTFSIQSAFWIPVADDLESVKENSNFPWLDYDMLTWWNQFFYDKTFKSSWQLFAEIDLLFRFNNGNGTIPSHLDTPMSVFVSWFPGNKTTVYSQFQYSPRFQLQSMGEEAMDGGQSVVDPFDFIADFAHAGLGFKYQLTKSLNVETSSTYFFTSQNGGAGWTFNLGIRVIH